jgi:hypothetical protein
MKRLALHPLSSGLHALVDEQDHARLARFRWSFERRSHTTYAYRFVRRAGKSFKVYLHREVLGALSSAQAVDHRDHNGLNCQRANLRPCTAAQNAVYRLSPPRSSGIPYRGVYPTGGKSGRYRARIREGGRYVGLGSFDRPEDAARAYDQRAAQLHGAFAILNFPKELP